MDDDCFYLRFFRHAVLDQYFYLVESKGIIEIEVEFQLIAARHFPDSLGFAPEKPVIEDSDVLLECPDLPDEFFVMAQKLAVLLQQSVVSFCLLKVHLNHYIVWNNIELFRIQCLAFHGLILPFLQEQKKPFVTGGPVFSRFQPCLTSPKITLHASAEHSLSFFHESLPDPPSAICTAQVKDL